MSEPGLALKVDGESLRLQDVVQVARHQRLTSLAPDARERMKASHDWVQRAASGAIRDDSGAPLPVYGVNTGYGSLARVRIRPDQIRDLSWNLVRSHAAGVGPPVPSDAVRAMMLLRANALAKGASGCRPVVVERLLQMLNHGVVPEVPSRGSCGSSGDLAPLAHLGLVLFRGDRPEESGKAWHGDELLTGEEAMQRAGLERLYPGPKEGLAITNGAQLCTAIAALAGWDATVLIRTAEIAAAMSWEALRGVSRALHPGVHALRPYPGAIRCAANLRRLIAGSTLIDSLDNVQDAYSLRCTPQVVGAVRDATSYAVGQVTVELNAVTDNPLILLDTEGPNLAFSAGAFHGEPVGMAADHLKLALCELAAIAERRIFRMTTGTLSARLPPLLSQGADMGLMVHQATAASLVSENRSLAWPNTADSIPTCEDQEDLVAMSTAATRRCAEVLRNSQRVIAIELVCAAAGLAHRKIEEPSCEFGAGTRAIWEILAGVTQHRTPSEDIEAVTELVASGTLLSAVEKCVGRLDD